MRVAADTMKIKTLNVRTLRESGRLELLRLKTESNGCGILVVQEVRWLEDDHDRRGAGFLLSKRAKRCLIGRRK